MHILLILKACYPSRGKRNINYVLCSFWKRVTRMKEKACYRLEGTGTYFACLF